MKTGTHLALALLLAACGGASEPAGPNAADLLADAAVDAADAAPDTAIADTAADVAQGCDRFRACLSVCDRPSACLLDCTPPADPLCAPCVAAALVDTLAAACDVPPSTLQCVRACDPGASLVSCLGACNLGDAGVCLLAAIDDGSADPHFAPCGVALTADWCPSCLLSHRRCDTSARGACGPCVLPWVDDGGACSLPTCQPGGCGPNGVCDESTTPPICRCEPGFGRTLAGPCEPALITNSFVPIAPPGQPAPTFWQGQQAIPASAPCHPVTLQTPYALMRLEVSRAEFGRCVDAGVCAPVSSCQSGTSLPPVSAATEGHPARCVPKAQARAYCAWVGGRLPTESEWEFAAVGPVETCPAGPWYPWGSAQIDGTLANFLGAEHPFAAAEAPFHAHGGPTTPVGFFDGRTWTRAEAGWVGGPETFATGDDASPFGLHDMAGNVAEWVEDCWHADYQGAPLDGSAWTDAADCGVSVKKGEAFSDVPGALTTWFRAPKDATVPFDYMGFRCAATLVAPTE